MNKVVLVGRLTRDPELRFAPGTGTATCRFTVAVNRFKKGEADFINCVAWKRYTTDVNVESFDFIGGKEISDVEQPQNGLTVDEAFPVDPDITPVDDGDMPF